MADERGGADDDRPAPHREFGAGPNVWAGAAPPPVSWRGSADPEPADGSEFGAGPNVWADGIDPADARPPRLSRRRGSLTDPILAGSSQGDIPDLGGSGRPDASVAPVDAGRPGDSRGGPPSAAAAFVDPASADPAAEVRERLRALLDSTSTGHPPRAGHPPTGGSGPATDAPRRRRSGARRGDAADPWADDAAERPTRARRRKSGTPDSPTEWAPDAFISAPDSTGDAPDSVDDSPENGRSGRRRRGAARSNYGSEYDGDGSGKRTRGKRRTGEDAAGERARRQAPPPDPASAAREICLRLLSVRPRTRVELDAALRKRGVEDDVIAEVLERYADVGMIDDAAFAKAWVTSRHHSKGLAKRALAGELRRKGVTDDESGAALEQLDDETEEATARELVARRLKQERAAQRRPRRSPEESDGDDDQAALRKAQEALIRRLVGMLARKGYPAGMAFRIVKDALSEEIDNAETAELLDPDVFGAEEADFDQLRS